MERRGGSCNRKFIVCILSHQLGPEPLLITPFVAVLGSKKDLMHLKFKLHF